MTPVNRTWDTATFTISDLVSLQVEGRCYVDRLEVFQLGRIVNMSEQRWGSGSMLLNSHLYKLLLRCVVVFLAAAI